LKHADEMRVADHEDLVPAGAGRWRVGGGRCPPPPRPGRPGPRRALRARPTTGWWDGEKQTQGVRDGGVEALWDDRTPEWEVGHWIGLSSKSFKHLSDWSGNTRTGHVCSIGRARTLPSLGGRKTTKGWRIGRGLFLELVR